MRFIFTSLALIFACAAGLAAEGVTVTLQGMLGSKALLIVNGSAPKTVAPGETWQGVKVVSTSGQDAVIEVNGKRETLHVGDAPASVGGRGATRGSRLVFTAGSGGHFMSQGAINGKPVVFMVDTGATAVGLGESQAQRIGLDYKAGRPVQMGTANGVVTGWLVKLGSVRIGDVEVHEVDAIVSPAAMPYVLLGNSFLSRFQMQRTNDQMVLERRY
jgi:aspartyl protease family protein